MPDICFSGLIDLSKRILIWSKFGGRLDRGIASNISEKDDSIAH
jgi:hypothetical protein